jgi:hypothetical protein
MMNPELGIVALSDDFTKSMGVLESQRWPWDHSKGIYILGAYHNLHCLASILGSSTYHLANKCTARC